MSTEHVGMAMILVGVLGFSTAYVLYPLLLWIRSPRRWEVTNPAALPHIRLFVPTHNEAEAIVHKVRNLRDQNYPPDRLEIVVVDDGSTDGTDERVRATFGDSVLVHRLDKNLGKNGALNSAQCSMPRPPGLVGTTDVDALLAPGVLRTLAVAFDDPSIGVAGARAVYRSPDDSQFTEQRYFGYESTVRALESRTGQCVCISGVLELHRPEVWEPLPPDVATDMGTALAALAKGSRVVVVNDAIVRTGSTGSIGNELERKARTVRRGLRAISWKWAQLPLPIRLNLFGHKLLRYMLPLFQLSVLIGTALVTTLERELVAACLAAQVLVYSLIAIGWVIARSGRRKPGLLQILTTAHYFQAVHLIALVETLGWILGRSKDATNWNRVRDDLLPLAPMAPPERDTTTTHLREVA